ncbi:TonB-dependent receptor [Undibacterium piscinae]|uniref:TonB-dependent receptor n=1 Tax=Undibacterium piscinae TaxID=2495591 RepID=A0A6M4A306_9BURK|nr:TonB-dependent receptor [Undibacterium piscinae]
MTLVFKPLAISLAVAALFPSASAFAEPAQNVIVTAGRQPQLAKDVLADNVVISAEEIAKSGAVSVVDLLQKQRGIEITRNGGPGTNSSVFIRGGSNAQSVAFVDGVRIGSSTTGGASWASIPLSQIERIEIVYGPLSSLYGADAMGGVVQIFTKKGGREIAPSVSIGVGSYGLRKAEAGISGATASNFSYALNAAHETADGYSATKPSAFGYNSDKDGYTQDSVSGRLGWELSKGFDLGLNFLQSRLDSQYDSGANYDSRSEQKLETVSVFAKAKLASNWLSALQLAQTADNGTNDAAKGKSKSKIDTTQNSLNWQNDISIGKDVLQLVFERREEKVETTTRGVNGRRNTDSYAASYVLKRDAHLASASVRNDVSSQYGSHTTGSIAYGYRLTSDLRLNASYGTSFRAPTFNELYYPGYGISTNKPEEAKNGEAGIFFDDNTSQFSAVYYNNKATDLLVSTTVCPILPTVYKFGCAYNVDKATMSGFTFGGSTTLGNLTIRGSLDLQDPVDDKTGKLLARRSKEHGSLAMEYAMNKLKLGIEGTFSGQRFDDIANTKPLPGYGLLNLYASYDVAPNWTVLGRFNNALNKDYETVKNYAMAGSNVFVGLSYGYK